MLGLLGLRILISGTAVVGGLGLTILPVELVSLEALVDRPREPERERARSLDDISRLLSEEDMALLRLSPELLEPLGSDTDLLKLAAIGDFPMSRDPVPEAAFIFLKKVGDLSGPWKPSGEGEKSILWLSERGGEVLSSSSSDSIWYRLMRFVGEVSPEGENDNEIVS